MSDFLERISHFSAKRLALLADELQERLQGLEGAAHEPIAIVGIGCRFPGGADTPEKFWELVRDGVDAVTEVPANRWAIDDWYDADPDAPGKMNTRYGGFLDRVDGFDPQFFAVSPREAQSMDPQQRLLLEVTWEALEHAGIPPERLAGTRTGVFIGMSAGDYYQVLRQGGVASFDAYTASGVAHSIASGRLSYVLGIRGPSVSIDTACSSSLLAIHQAVQSLRRGECTAALAGGVNLILGPDITVALSRSHMLAPDGHCKTFDASADGFVRGEGCGILVLKRLADAEADGDTIVALIRGSAANQDGRSNGLTAPNGPSQEAVLAEALANARVAPQEVGFVEAHGTGTSLGDPIEVQALARVLAQSRGAAGPLYIGSVKANVGHLEAAAGVAGVVKMAMALKYGQVPGQLHLRTPNPFIPWQDLAVHVPRELSPWPQALATRRVGGVSSFGFSGTNVHLILSQAPERAAVTTIAPREVQLLTLSARGQGPLHELAGQYAKLLSAPGASLADVAFGANTGRAQLPQRVALLAASGQDAAEKLDAWRQGGEIAGVQEASAAPRAPRVAFLFTGQGSQSPGMARGLYDCEPVFRAALDQCAELLQPLLPQPLLAVLFAPAASPALIDATEYTQPALFAVEYSLAQLWMSWGVKPSIVMGHSVGEFVAACVAGVFSLQDALRLIAERGRLMGALPRNGAMLAVNADEAAVGAWLAPFRQDVSIAAVNGPAATVLSGLATAIDTIAAQLDNKGIGYTRLKVSHAFHSPLMAPMLAGFERVAQSVSYALPQLDLYSNVTGELSDAAIATATYWRDHISAPVRFADALAAIAAAGCDVFVEVGPHPTLIGMGQACLPADQQQWLPSLRRGRPDGLQIQESLARLHVQGVSIDWRGFHLGRERPQVDLPRYPFQRTRYWAEFAKTGTVTQVESLHPLLGREVLQSLSAERLFEAHIEISRLPYLRDHRILGALLLPSPAHMEMALAAAAQQFGASALEVRDFTVHRALSLEGEQAVAVQLAMSPQNEGVCDFRIASFDAGEREWRVHATGALAVAGAAGPVADLKDIEARVTQPQSVPAYYEWLTTLGLQFGDTFRGVESIARRDGEVLARMQLPAALVAGRLAYRLHPALLDACLHVVGAALPGSGSTLGDAFLLLNVERIRWHRPVGERFWNHVIIEPDAAVDLANRETLRASLRLLDDDGQILVAFEGMHFKRARPESLLTTSLPVRVRRMLHEVVWREVEVRGIEPLTPAQISGRLLDSVFALAQRNGLDAYADFLPRLDALASAYVVAALRELGFDFVVGGHLDANVLASQLHVLPTHSRLFGRMLDMLREDGVLHREGTGLRVAKQPEQRLPEDLYNEILAQHPDCEAELTLTRRCAGQLAPVLKGEADPLALLFPGGSLADTERLYRNSPPAKTYNGVIAEIVRALAATWTSGRPLRVLEIGAGTGSTTGYVLPLLAAQGAEYTFTDVSPLFLNRARDKFGTDGAVRYALLDISRAPVEQGFTRAGYDLIIGANVIHATPDLDVTLTHVRELLAPGATLLLLEGTSPQRFGDLTVGLLDGWWAYTDLTRRDYALMSRAAWLELFAAQGLRGSLALPGDTTHPVLAQQAVFIAQRAPAQTNAALPVVADRWVLLCADDELGSTLAAELRRRGAQVELLSDAVALQETLSDPRPIRGVVSLAPVAIGLDDDLSTARIEADQRRLVESLLHTVHALATVTRREVPPLWIVTRGAQSAAQPESANAAQATAWGMSHVIALEHPELRCRRVDLDGAATTVAAAGSLADELLAVSGEDQLALRAGRRLARRLVHHDAGRAPAGALHIDPHRSYLITGGLRGLGLRVAEWLVGQGARHLVLMGRKSPDATASAVMARLRGRGVQVTPVQGDVSSASDVAGMLDVFGTTLPALAGVVHAAGALDDGVIASQDWSRFATVMAPKVMGTWNLHTLCGELDFLVLFSSGASVAGSPGQVNHAAANAFEDALSWYRQSQGRPTLSINWGPWAEIGAAADRQLDQPGSLRAIAPADGLMALQYAMRRADARALFATAQLAVLDTDWEHLAELRVIQTEPPLFAELAIVASRQVVAAATSSPTRVEPSLAERIAASAFNRRKAVLRDHVRALTVEVLGLQQAEEFDINEPLRQLGLDSLMAVELRNLLGKAVGRTLPATVTFDQPSVAALTDYLAREVFAELLVDASAPEENVQAATPAPAADSFAELSDNELALQLLRRLDDLSTLENP